MAGDDTSASTCAFSFATRGSTLRRGRSGAGPRAAGLRGAAPDGSVASAKEIRAHRDQRDRSVLHGQLLGSAADCSPLDAASGPGRLRPHRHRAGRPAPMTTIGGVAAYNAADSLNLVGLRHRRGAVRHAAGAGAAGRRAPRRTRPRSTGCRSPRRSSAWPGTWANSPLPAAAPRPSSLTPPGLSGDLLPGAGLLAAVVVHSVARGLRYGRVVIVAGLRPGSATATVLHVGTLVSGDPAAVDAGLQLLTVAFGLLDRCRWRSHAVAAERPPRAVDAGAGRSSRSRPTTSAASTPMPAAGGCELLGHHAAIPLAFAILYQDYRFALADLFLKQALTLLAIVALP